MIWHTPVDFHKFLDAKAFERRNNRLELRLHENGVKSVLIAYGLEDVQLDERQTMAFAIFEFLEELALRLVIEVRVLGVLDVTQPDG